MIVAAVDVFWWLLKWRLELHWQIMEDHRKSIENHQRWMEKMKRQ